MKLAPLATVLLAAQGAGEYGGSGARVWREIRQFVAEFTDWASRNLIPVLIAVVAVAFLWGLVFAKPRRR